MTPAYSELYVKNAKEIVGEIFDYSINVCGFTPTWASKIFLASMFSRLIAKGNPAILVGLTKEEAAYLCIRDFYKDRKLTPVLKSSKITKEYWAGTMLAAYQHQSGLSFGEILETVSFRQFIELYDYCYQMELSSVMLRLEKYFKKEEMPAKLKTIRLKRGLSQSELAEKSGVTLRMIQLYEQKVNDIDNAQVGTIYKLANALNCDIKDLLEKEY